MKHKMPNLTYTSITIEDRIQYMNDHDIVHCIESLRVMLLSLERDIFDTNIMASLAPSWFSIIGMTVPSIILYYYKSRSSFISLDDAIDLINYYNNNIENINKCVLNNSKSEFVKIDGDVVVDINYIVKHSQIYEYVSNTDIHIKLHTLGISLCENKPSLFVSDVYDDMPLVVNGVLSDRKMEKRLEYVKSLENLITICPVNEFVRLKNTIEIENCRINLMDIMNYDFAEDFKFDMAFNLLYEILFDCIIYGISIDNVEKNVGEFIYFYNIIIKENTEFENYILDSNSIVTYFGDLINQNGIYEYLINKFRIDKIKQIIE